MTGTSGTRSGGLRNGQSPCELLGGLSGFLSRRRRGLRPCVESVQKPEDSSPVLTWILGYFWSLPRGVSPRLERGNARALSSRAVAAVSRFPRVDHGICGFPSRLSREAFPQGCPTCHRVGSRSSAESRGMQGEEFSLEWTETSGGLWEWWHEPGVPLAFPVESTSS